MDDEVTDGLVCSSIRIRHRGDHGNTRVSGSGGLVNEYDVMMVMDNMSQMYETLVKRIAALKRDVDELRAVRKQEPRTLVRGLDESFMDMHQ